MKSVGSNQSDVKYANQYLIMNEIMKNNTIARTDLAKYLKLSNPSISKNVYDLINKKLILETGTVDTNVGRKPKMLTFNPNFGCVAAIDLSSTELRIVLSDMAGQTIDFATINGVIRINISIINAVMNELETLYNKNRSRCGKLLAICIGSPGDIDVETGYYIYAPRFEGATKINIRKIFSSRFNVDVIVKNDINLAVKGEKVYGIGNGSSNIIYICVDFGIGSGLFLNGKLYEGTSGFAGEIGLLNTNFQDSLNNDGKSSYTNNLDYAVSVFGIISYVKDMIRDGADSILKKKYDDIDKIDFYDIIDAYNNDDEVCKKAIKRSAVYLGCAIKNICDLLDLEFVIIGGLILKLGDDYIKIIKDFLQTNYETAPPKIKRSVLDSKATIYGAIGEAIEASIHKIISGD